MEFKSFMTKLGNETGLVSLCESIKRGFIACFESDEFGGSDAAAFAEALANWCKENGVIDTTFVVGNDHYSYKERIDSVIKTTGSPFSDYVDYDLSEYGDYIGMITEGALNYAIHYGTNERLYEQFTRFLASHGWTLKTFGNCYNAIVRI